MLDESVLAGQAAREVAEERGVGVGTGDLKQRVATRSEKGSVGLTYLAPPVSEASLRTEFTATAAAECVQGREPELDDIALDRSPDEPAGLVGPHADYLEPFVRRFFEYR